MSDAKFYLHLEDEWYGPFSPEETRERLAGERKPMSTEAKFFLLLDDEPAGPFSLETLRTMLAAGKVRGATLWSTDGATQWQPLSELQELKALILSGRPAASKPAKDYVPFEWVYGWWSVNLFLIFFCWSVSGWRFTTR
jgi:hypothetical protein